MLQRFSLADITLEEYLQYEKGEADFPFTFTEGTTYYVYVARCNGAQWDYSTTVYTYTHGEGGQDTADLSVVAYAVTAIAGLGALVVAKKR